MKPVENGPDSQADALFEKKRHALEPRTDTELEVLKEMLGRLDKIVFWVQFFGVIVIFNAVVVFFLIVLGLLRR